MMIGGAITDPAATTKPDMKHFDKVYPTPYGTHWIKNRYFGQLWRFHAKLKDDNGNHKTIYLYRAADVPIRRHIKIKARANPYHPAWEHYFEQRIQTKMAHHLQSRPRLLYLYNARGHHLIIWGLKGRSPFKSKLVGGLHPPTPRFIEKIRPRSQIALFHSTRSAISNRDGYSSRKKASAGVSGKVARKS